MLQEKGQLPWNKNIKIISLSTMHSPQVFLNPLNTFIVSLPISIHWMQKGAIPTLDLIGCWTKWMPIHELCLYKCSQRGTAQNSITCMTALRKQKEDIIFIGHKAWNTKRISRILQNRLVPKHPNFFLLHCSLDQHQTKKNFII